MPKRAGAKRKRSNQQVTLKDSERRASRNSCESRGFRQKRYRFQLATIAVLIVLAVSAGGYLAWRALRAPPAVTITERLDEIDPQLALMIERHVEAARGSPWDARQRAKLGLVYEANDLWPEARSCYMNAAALEPNEPMWPHHAATAWQQMGDIAGATEWMRRYAERFPTFAPLQHRLGVALLATGEVEEADVAFRRVMTHAPKNSAGYVGHGEVALRTGGHAEAVEILEEAVNLDSTNKAARYLLGRAYRGVGRMEDAERELTLGMGAPKKSLLDAWSEKLSEYVVGLGSLQVKAVALLKAGKPAQAAQILERVLESQPSDVDALVNLGIAWLRMGRLDEARDALLRAEVLDGTRFETHINLATLHRRLGQTVDALDYADRAVEVAPQAAKAHLTRGLVLMQLQENEEALQALSTAEGLDARNPNIQQELGNVYVRLRRYAEALTHYQSLARLLPTRWEPQLGLTKVNLLMGRFDEAEGALNAGLEMAPDEPSLQALGRRLRELDDR